jgi:PAS domain S-box-containing protein
LRVTQIRAAALLDRFPDHERRLREPRGPRLLHNLRRQALRYVHGLAKPLRLWARSIMLAAGLAVAYFLAARLSLALLTKPDGVAVFWPAAGVASGVLIALGPAARLPVIIGAMAATIAANLLGDRSLWSAVIFAVCNAGEAVIVAFLIERSFGSPFGLDRLRQVLGLVAAAVIGAALSGVGGTIGYVLFHTSATDVGTIWYHWFTSDALGIVTVAPILIGLASYARDPAPRTEVIEGLSALAALSLLSGIVIFLPRQSWATVVPLASLFPLLLWLAARCRPVFAAGAAFIVTLTIVWTTTFGIGIFGDARFPITERILWAQAAILAVALCAFVLAALFAERRQHERELMESEARLQEALTAGAVTAFDWDVRSGLSRRSGNAAELLGFDPKEPFGAARFLERVHPEDRLQFKAVVRGVHVGSPSYAATFRYLRPDGREVWLEETAKAELDGAGHFVRLKGLTVDITERKHAQTRQDLLTAELDHRVKNVLARVAVVARRTREHSSSMAEFVRALDGRIHSMAAAHSLLSQSRWQGVGLADLVRDQLAPYATDANARIQGPNIVLTAAATQSVAMVLHELVTNAAKYGALSAPDGQVSVSWERLSRDGEPPKLTMTWREMGGPPAAAPLEAGFGTNLIRDLIPHELGGTVDLSFGAEGLCCTIEVPIERL